VISSETQKRFDRLGCASLSDAGILCGSGDGTSVASWSVGTDSRKRVSRILVPLNAAVVFTNDKRETARRISMADSKAPINMHAARTAMNRNPEVRAWVEEWLKAQERERYLAAAEGTETTFEKHWLYVRPETMHERALEGYAAYVAQAEC
jgi:hypothetical protein